MPCESPPGDAFPADPATCVIAKARHSPKARIPRPLVMVLLWYQALKNALGDSADFGGFFGDSIGKRWVIVRIVEQAPAA
jgi:hypothetical protein